MVRSLVQILLESSMTTVQDKCAWQFFGRSDDDHLRVAAADRDSGSGRRGRSLPRVLTSVREWGKDYAGAFRAAAAAPRSEGMDPQVLLTFGRS